MKSNAPKPPNQRKTWRKSMRKPVIQLVPSAEPAAASQDQNSAAPTKPDNNNNNNNNMTETPDIPLKLPRAISSTLANNTLKDRNSSSSDSVHDKDFHLTVPKSPQRRPRTKNEKENQ